MIEYNTVKTDLLEILEKALKKLGKLHGKHKGDHTGLVQVERTVNKKGTTFIQTFWIKPDQVKKTDVVLKRDIPDVHKESKELVSHKTSNNFFGTADEKDSSFGKWVHNLLKYEAHAIYTYTAGGWYKILNKFLRNKPRPTSETQPNDKYSPNLINDLYTLTKHLDKAISEFELKEPITVYRQVKQSSIQGVLDNLMKSTTKMFVDPAFVSTSTVDGSYSPINSDHTINLKIDLPAGKGIGAWVSPIARYPKENEFLLARGCVFQMKTDLSQVDWTQEEINLEVKLVGVLQTPPDIEHITNLQRQSGKCSEEPDESTPLNLNKQIGKLVEYQMNWGVTFKDSVNKSIKYQLMNILYKSLHHTANG